MYTPDPARKRCLPAVLFLLAPAIACSGSSDFTASHAPDASTDEDAGDNTNIVANPNADAREAGTSPAGVDATAGLPIVDASGPDAGVSDASGPDALFCPSMDLACDGGCLTNDLLNCGGCGKACAMPANGTATCSASDAGFACGVSCSANFTHCGSSCVDVQTDSRNCDSCGHDCLGGTCASGGCQPWVVIQTTNPILGWPNGPTLSRGQIVSDGKNIVWADTQGVLEVPVSGGAAITLAPLDQNNGFSGSLAMANGHVVWNSGVSVWTATEGQQNSGTVSASVGSTTADYARDIALDTTGTIAYFIVDSGNNGSTQGVLYKCDLTTTVGNACSVLKNVPAPAPGGPNNVIVLGSKLYWTDSANGSIWYADDSPFNNPFALITGQTYGPYFLRADSTYLYWAGIGSNAGDFTISRAPLATPTAIERLVPSTADATTVMAVDSTNLYFESANNLGYIPLAGSVPPGGIPVHPLAATDPIALAVAGGAIYWLSGADRKIYGLRFP